MARCTTIPKKKRTYCIGDLRDEITLETRSITPASVFDEVDYDEAFTDPVTVSAAVNTINGKTFFDGVNTETPVTHTIGLRFIDGVTAEDWVTFNGNRLDILMVENLDSRSIWMELTCVDRGLLTQEASKA